MNKHELIKKAIAEDTLRRYNLLDAQVGDKVLGWAPGEVIAVWRNEVVFGWDHDTANSYLKSANPNIYLAPLCWVLGKPVYKGDVLYGTWFCSAPKGYVIDGVQDGNLTCDGVIIAYSLEDLTWTKPKPLLININGHKVPAPERVPPEVGTKCWIVYLTGRYEIDNFIWDGCSLDERFLERGLLHLTKEAALAHAKALLSFTKEAK